MDTTHWTQPQVLSQSDDGFGSTFNLNKWNNTLAAFSADRHSLTVYLLQADGKMWKETAGSQTDLPFFFCDPVSPRCVLCQTAGLGTKLIVDFSVGSIDNAGALAVSSKQSWQTDKDAFFVPTGGNVSFGGWKNIAATQPFPGGRVDGHAIYAPYCIRGETTEAVGLIASKGPFDNGVFYSLDDGRSWQRQRISATTSVAPVVRKTAVFYYFLATVPEDHELWFSRTPVDDNTWSEPATITKQLGRSGFKAYSAATQDDTIHVCWADRRHEKRRADLLHPWRENFEIAYSHRKDSDAGWSKEIIVSKGLLYAYHPSISVEGSRVVIVWSGIQHASDGHSLWSPNEVFFVTSKDAGKTWTEPLAVTDNARAGLADGKPEVELLNGVIHLCYIQGKLRSNQVMPGLRLLNQPPWPIYYQQRPFPN